MVLLYKTRKIGPRLWAGSYINMKTRKPAGYVKKNVLNCQLIINKIVQFMNTKINTRFLSIIAKPTQITIINYKWQIRDIHHFGN